MSHLRGDGELVGNASRAASRSRSRGRSSFTIRVVAGAPSPAVAGSPCSEDTRTCTTQPGSTAASSGRTGHCLGRDRSRSRDRPEIETEVAAAATLAAAAGSREARESAAPALGVLAVASEMESMRSQLRWLQTQLNVVQEEVGDLRSQVEEGAAALMHAGHHFRGSIRAPH